MKSGEVTFSFACLITFWLCEAAEIEPLITAALVGISGHMGSRALYQFERWAQTRLDNATT
ncbi:phage holin family protein [Azovibrio sp.]|uniref:phage holin family protein n=1 Tax=Azovibrio sp. TaxID=1872673 RepID=UPI003C78AEC5